MLWLFDVTNVAYRYKTINLVLFLFSAYIQHYNNIAINLYHIVSKTGIPPCNYVEV